VGDITFIMQPAVYKCPWTGVVHMNESSIFHDTKIVELYFHNC